MPRYDHDDIDQRDAALIARIARWGGPLLRRYFRAEVRGIERIAEGPGLYVGNHSGGALTPDTFLFCAELFNQKGIDAIPFGLGHKIVIDTPGIREIVVPLGAVYASHDNAHRLFARGHKVLVYPGGDLDAFRPFSRRNEIEFGGRTGYIRLALREDVPVYPIVAAGAHAAFIVLTDGRRIAPLLPFAERLRVQVWPLVFSLPWGLTPFPAPPYLPLPTRIIVEALEPIHFDRHGLDAASDQNYVDACDRQIRDVMQAALTRLAAERLSKKRGIFR